MKHSLKMSTIIKHFLLIATVSLFHQLVNKKKYHFFFQFEGPRKNTASDFWSMVWQERVNQVVMLTNLMEGVKVINNL